MKLLIVFCFVFISCQALISSETISPPRGWNSWICYKGCINETQFLDNVGSVHEYLQPYGYEYVVIDGGWYLDGETGVWNIDEYGRPIPSVVKFPSSANGTGFKTIVDKVHEYGLKFGIWAGRGINNHSLAKNTPIYGTDGIYAKDIVDYNLECPWAKALYGLNMSKNGSQEYYDSLYQLYNSWGVDFIKFDCVFGGNFVFDQINGASKAIYNQGKVYVRTQ